MDPIDKAVSELCQDIAKSNFQKADRSRHRRLLRAARELALKPGTSLSITAHAMCRIEEEDHPQEEFNRFMALPYAKIGLSLIFYAVNTRAGSLIATTALSQGKDPFRAVADAIQGGLNILDKAAKVVARSKRKTKKQK